MSNESFEGLVGALRAVGPASSPAKIASLIAPTMNELSEETITDIIGALLSLYNVKSVNELDSEELIDDVGKAISLAKLPASPDVELLKQRFTVLLDIPSLVISAKAFAIQREQPRVFAAARTFSDIRPVFSDDGERPLGALVQHQLKISYIEGAETKELFVLLDDEDISILQKILTRAQTKSKALASLVEKANLVKLS
jgi:hypothetical protein